MGLILREDMEMKRRILAAVLISLLCTMFIAGCAKNTDNGLKDTLEIAKEKTEERDQDEVKSEKSNESNEAKEDKAGEESLAQRMAGKYRYCASDKDEEEEYYIMDVVPFGNNLYAFCGQAFSDNDESLEAYTFWATEFVPYDADEMSSTDADKVRVNELCFSIMSNAGKYWDAGHTGTITLADDGLVFEGFDHDGFLVPFDGDDSRTFIKDDRVEDAFPHLSREHDRGDKDLQGLWSADDGNADLYIEFSGSDMYMYRKCPDREVFFAAGRCDFHDRYFSCTATEIQNGGMPFEFTANYEVRGDRLSLDIMGDDVPDQLAGPEAFYRITKDDVHITTMDEIVFNEDSFGAFGQQENEQDDLNEEVYDPVFTEILDVIDYGYNIDREYDYLSGSLTEHINYGGMKDPLNEVGYRLEDISGDGIPELLTGYDADYLHDGGESYITGIYTIKDGKPHVAYAGGPKGSCQRLDDTRFFSTLSGGVSLTVFGDFHLSNDGCDMLWDDCYFADEKGDGSVGYYHNKTGVIDAGLSEEMQNGDEVFNEIMDDLAYNCIRIDWTPIGTRKK
ncbi:MAG: hypothetical protein K6G22_07690 [Lachnospiraceae bacterium]|nr:hypothetical protein [Lachnospiraceae bacterium]